MTQNNERRMRVTDDHVEDDLDSVQMLAEDLVLLARTKAGVSKEICDKARNEFKNFDGVIQELVDLELIKLSDGGFAPTEKG